jgi:hypothetical protein
VVLLETLPGNQAVQASRSSKDGARVELLHADPADAIKAYEAEQNPLKRGRIYAESLSRVISGGGNLPIQAAAGFGTLVGNLISQRVLELLKLQLPALNRITTDFSDEQVKYGQSVISRYIAIPTVAAYNTGTGYAVTAQDTTDVTVTMNNHKSVLIPLNANDASGTARRLFDEYAPAASYALAKDLIDTAYALILIATYTNATTKATASVTRADVIDMASALSARGCPMGPDFRTLLCSSAVFAQLAKDTTIISLAAYQQADIITDGSLPNIHGFKVIEAPNLPATANLTGFGMSKSAIVAATRLPLDYANVLPGSSYGSVQTVTDPNTGASLVQAQYVDHKLGTANYRLAWMYGVAAGQAAAGQILKSA